MSLMSRIVMDLSFTFVGFLPLKAALPS